MAAAFTEESLKRAIESAINQEIEKAVKEAIDGAKMHLDREIARIVSTVSLQVAKQFSIQYLRDEIVIHVRLEGR